MPLEFAVIECPTVDVAVQVLNEARKRCSGSLSANPNYSRAHRQEENKTHFFARINLFQRDLRAIDRGTATLHTGTTSSLYLVDLVGFTDIDSHYYKTLPNKDKIIVRNRNLQLQSLLQLVQEMASICRNALQYPSRPMEHMQRYAKLLESKALTSARSSKLSKLLAPIIQGNTRTVVLGFVEDSIPAFEHTRDLITQLQYVPEVRSAVYKLEDVPFHDLDFKSHLTVLGPRFDAKLHKRPPPPPQQPQQQQAENTGLIFTSAKEEPVYQPDTRAAEQFRTLLESVQGHHDTSTNATSVPPPDAVNNEYQHSHHHHQQQEHQQQHLQRKQPTASVTATAAMTHHQAAATTTTTTRKTISAQEINLTNLLEDEFDLTNFDRTPQTVSSGSRRTSDLSSRDDGTHSGSISQQLVDDIQRLVPDVAHPNNSRSHTTARDFTAARDVPRTNVPFSPPRPAGQAASHRDHHHHDQQQPVNTSSVSNAASTSAIQHLMDEFHSLMHMVERPASVSSAPTGRPAGIQQASHGGGAASSTTTAASITVQQASVGRLPQEPSRPWPAHHYFSSAPAQSVPLPPRSESASPLRSSSTTTTLGHNSHRRGYDHDSLLRKALSSAEDDLENLTRVKESLILALQNEKAHRMRLEQENQQLRDGYVEIRAQHEVEVDALQYSVHHLKSQVKKLCEQGACLDVFEAFEKDVQRLTRENDILRETNLKLEWQFVDSETQMEDVQVDVVSLAEIAHTTNPEEKEVLERKRRLQQQWNRNGTKQKTLMERLKASGKEREAWKQEYERLKSKERQFIVAERMKEDTSRRLKKAFYDLQVLKKESEQQSVRLMEMDRENNILKHDVEQFQKSDELLRAERDRLLSEVAELRTKIRFFEAEESRVAKLNKFVSKHTTASSHGAGGSYARNENEAGAAINIR
eukprot:gene7775-5593_t